MSASEAELLLEHKKLIRRGGLVSSETYKKDEFVMVTAGPLRDRCMIIRFFVETPGLVARAYLAEVDKTYVGDDGRLLVSPVDRIRKLNPLEALALEAKSES